MKVLHVQAIALTPLTLAGSAGEDSGLTMDRIEGSTIRGALASHLLLAKGPAYADDPEFRTLFLSERVLFRDAVPEDDAKPTRPVPASSLTCKRLPGEHSWRDLLLAPGLADGDGLPQAPEVCRVCQAPLQAWQGMVAQATDTPHSLERGVKTGAEIDDNTQSTRTGRLFAREYLEHGTRFSGSVVVAEDVAFPNWASLEVRVGRRKSTQGLVLVKFQDGEAVSSPRLDQRLARFQQHRGVFGMGEDEVLFSLTCLSDTAIADRCLRCLDRIPADILQARLQHLGWQQGGTMRMLRLARRTSLRYGWHAAHGLPKEPLRVISPGSVFLYRAQGDRPSLERALARLELEGIGLRRNEGLGQVIVCDPWAVTFRYQGSAEGGAS